MTAEETELRKALGQLADQAPAPQPLADLDRTGRRLLIDDRGNLDYAALNELSRRRDETPIFLAE